MKEGGVFPADKKFLQGLRKLCNENKLLLLLDEIQCGMGRTGKFCAYEHYSIVPDILTMAKPIAGGLPMGVILLTDEVGQYMNVGSHGSTFGGGPLVSSVAEYVVKRVTEKSFLAKITENGKYLVSALEMLKRSQKMMKSIRGKGLIVGVEFKDDPTVVVNACYTNGLLVCKAGNNTLRFIPPLIAEKVHIDECIDKFDRALNAVGEENA